MAFSPGESYLDTGGPPPPPSSGGSGGIPNNWLPGQSQPFSPWTGVAPPSYGTYTPFNYSPFLSPNQSTLSQYSRMPGQATNALDNVSSLARMLEGEGSNLYGVGMPAYTAAANYYQTLLGGNQAAVNRAVSPQLSAAAAAGAGSRNAILAGNLQGAARDEALANASTANMGNIASIVPGAINNAASQAGALGLQGATAGAATQAQGAGLSGTVAGAYNQYQQAANSLELANRQMGGQLGLGASGLNLQDILGQGSLNLQQYLGQAGINMQNFLGQGQLNLGQGYLGLAQQMQPAYLQLAQQQLQAQEQQMKGQGVGQLFGGAASMIPFFSGGGGGGGASFFDPYGQQDANAIQGTGQTNIGGYAFS